MSVGDVEDDAETYGRAVDAGEMTFEEAVSALVEAQQGGLTPYGAADLLANWKTVRADYARAERFVLPENPAELAKFVKQYGKGDRARFADLDFAMENGIVPTRFRD
ncbi:hypothetical protein [Streptomyces spectabilis]|uniref:Uncharacterized protein n=1 Tax=Streptomyces spectabilis TaxID=68270 RepID=A0A7W8B3E6_STRST|nr:hypothetical protein [Streptomyces spectabilis]MBB5109639.1 hypothetical protein [Streptomyces spectabilis]GGV54912.1 hypothetical protein GCM10010245_86880 [Streptomyces spectabilis]